MFVSTWKTELCLQPHFKQTAKRKHPKYLPTSGLMRGQIDSRAFSVPRFLCHLAPGIRKPNKGPLIQAVSFQTYLQHPEGAQLPWLSGVRVMYKTL